MARAKSRLRIDAEYLAVRAALGGLAALPPWLAFRVTERLGDLVYLADRKHRQVALANLAATFGGSPADAVHRRTARQVFRNFLRVGAEFVLLPRLIARRGLDELVEVDGRQHVEAVRAAGRGCILFSAHLGNWEVVAAMAEPLGIHMHSVGRRLDNPRLDAFLTERRARYAASVIPKEGGLPRVVRALKRGESVAMLLDQHAGRQGIVVDFLGRPASTFRAAAELAIRFGAPLLGGYGVRIDPAPRFRLVFEPPLWPDETAPRESEVRRLTEAVSASIGRRVKAHPEQWNWLHRRWRAPRASEPEPAGVESTA